MTELTHKVLVAPAFLPTEEEQEKRDKDAGPLGEELANVLAAGLEARGWRVEYRWTTFEGHAFDARRKEQRYDVEITSLDTSATLTRAGPRPPDVPMGERPPMIMETPMGTHRNARPATARSAAGLRPGEQTFTPDAWQGHWALVAKRRSGLFSRFRSKRYDANEHALLRLHLDEALAGEARVAASGEWRNEADFMASV